MTVMKYGLHMSEVNIKEELKNLDRNNFTVVCELVDKIIFDLTDILMNDGDEVMVGTARDYMIDLINPDLLDFDSVPSKLIESNGD
jgi:hypothetical protein